MDGYTLERLGLTPNHDEWRPPPGDPTKQPVYQGAEIKPEERKPEELLCTLKSGAQGRGFNPHVRRGFLAILGSEISR